jgi:hypothetical protein
MAARKKRKSLAFDKAKLFAEAVDEVQSSEKTLQ